MASVVSFQAWPNVVVNREIKPRFGVRVRGLGDDGQTLLSSDTVAVNGSSFPGKKKEANGALVGGEIGEKEKSGALVDVGNGSLKSRNQKTWVKDAVSKDLEVLWDDGYGTKTVKDYLEGAKEIINLDGGPPRWFCPVDCGHPLKDTPILLFLPGMDGVGLGLMLHHKALGKVFEVRCLHIPVYDRTPFDGLVKIVEETVRLEHASNPKKPIYIVSESFGACIALAVAARNPKVDLVVILANPATSFGRSQLQPLLPLLEAWPAELQNAIPYALSFVMGDPMKMAMVDIEYTLPSGIKMEQLSNNLSGLLPSLCKKTKKAFTSLCAFYLFCGNKGLSPGLGLADIIPKETLLWKLKLLKTGAAYANSRLHAVKAEVLVLASGKDNMLPSREEAERLYNSIENCVVRYFKDNGHTIFLEDGVNLLTVIKGTNKYRRSSKLDFVADFVPPSISEFKRGYSELVGLLRFLAGSTMFSTLDDGKIVKGLAGVPNEGPVLFVGYHMLLGLEVYSLVEEFIRQKNVVVRGIAHPEFFSERKESSSTEFSVLDWLPVMGAVPVSASNLFKLLSTNSHVLLYPGGAREALHNRGEEYKLFWPDQPEFVRMAVRFGATIVPFGTVGEDDIAELALDYNDLMKIPIVNDFTRETASKATRVRDESKGEVANQELFLPVVLPKVPGRFYFLFGKPIPTKGKEEVLKDRENVNRLYLEIKSEVESSIAYLLKKREEDPYRNIIDRTVYRALNSPLNETPAFDP